MRIIEGEFGDRPLPGPWSRRQGSPAPEAEVPGTAGGGSTARDDDRPLQGPWSPKGPEYRDAGAGRSGEGTPGNEGFSGSEGTPGGEGEGAGKKLPEPTKPREQVPRTGRPTHSGPGPERRREMGADGGSPGQPRGRSTAAGAGTDGGQVVAPSGRREAPTAVQAETGEECPAGQPGAFRDRRLRGIFCPAGIYAGIVMAEVLNGRGGRFRRQSSVFRRW